MKNAVPALVGAGAHAYVCLLQIAALGLGMRVKREGPLEVGGRRARDRRGLVAQLRADLAQYGYDNLSKHQIAAVICDVLRHEQYLRTALTTAGVAVATTDRDLYYDWVFKPFGMIPPEQILGRTDHDLVSAEIADAVEAIKREVMASRRGARQVLTVPTPAGDLVLDCYFEPRIGAAGVVEGIVQVGVDITRHQAAERRLRAARDKAEAAVTANSRSIARASHDLRQPFQAMRLFLDLLKPELTGARQTLILGKLAEAIESSQNLLDSLLDISAFDSGVVRVKLETFPLQEIFQALACEGEVVAGDKGVGFRVVPTSLWVTSDKAMLTRVLRNLSVNAVHYTRVGKVLLGARRRGDGVRIDVADTGIGIPDNQLSLIFEDFYRAETAEGIEGGLGLGLASVARLCRVLAHPVNVASHVGHGSLFCVTVPRGEPPA